MDPQQSEDDAKYTTDTDLPSSEINQPTSDVSNLNNSIEEDQCVKCGDSDSPKKTPSPKKNSVSQTDELSNYDTLKILTNNQSNISDSTVKTILNKINGIILRDPLSSPKSNCVTEKNDDNSKLAYIQDESNETDTLLRSPTKKNGNVFSGFISETKRPKSPSVPSNNAVLSETETQNTSKRNGIVKSESIETDRPVLHVQFHNGVGNSFGTLPLKSQCLSPTISTSSSSSSSDDNSSDGISEARAPDGGWGWVVVAAAFFVNLIADGITFSFGVIFVEFLNYFGESKSKTAWIGSFFMAMPLLSGPIASFLTDRYGCRKVSIVGSILASSGFIISSFTNSMEVLFITFGVFAGFGLSLCYVAAVVIVAYYFDKKRSFATGLSVCGSGIGTFIFAPLIQFLLDEYGWRGTTLIIAGLFLNLAVCGALMRDLPWTSNLNKAKAKDRKLNRKRLKNKNGSSADSFSVSNSTNTASALQVTNEVQAQNQNEDIHLDDTRLFTSLVNLPTFVNNGEKVPLEVLELLSTNKNVYNVLLHNYPGLLISSRSFSDSGRLNELTQSHPPFSGKYVASPSPLAIIDNSGSSGERNQTTQTTEKEYLLWLKKNQHNRHYFVHNSKRIPTAYLKDLRVHRHSLTYRGAMLNINRYRLRASSCPDIYRNSMTTIAKEKSEWYAGIWDFWDLIVDMLDFTHFMNLRFLLFAISNFLLYTWYDVPYVYLTDNAIEMGYDETDASILISVIGIVNMVGEIMLGWLGDKEWVNAGLVYAVCMCACGAITALVPLLSSYAGLVAVSGAFGFFIAGNYALTSIILVELITLERFTNAYGLLLLVQGVANLIGPPLAGWIYDITNTYDLPFYLAGLFIALSGMLLFILPATNRFKQFQKLQRQASNSSSVDEGTVRDPTTNTLFTSCISGDQVDKV